MIILCYFNKARVLRCKMRYDGVQYDEMCSVRCAVCSVRRAMCDAVCDAVRDAVCNAVSDAIGPNANG